MNHGNFHFDAIGRRAALLCLLTGLALGACTTSPESLQPALQYAGEAHGCSNLMVYKSNATGTEVILVEADKAALNLGTQPRTFDIASTQTGLRAQIDLYTRRPKEPRYCNDVLDASDPSPAEWRAYSGRVTITLSADSVAMGMAYTATVKLENATFYDRDHRRSAYLKEITFDNVTVGWLPG